MSWDGLAEVIWKASRADEGTISATGANIVAEAVRSHLTSDETLERVARAIFLSANPDGHGWTQYREDCLDDARAAMAAATEVGG